MVSITQNNKIAIAAVLIFLVSFSVMLLSINEEISSPEYIKASVLEAGAGEEDGHHVYFSEGGNSHGETAHEKSSEGVGEDANLDEVYKKALDGFGGAVFALLPEGKVQFLNERFSEEYGYSTDVAKGDTDGVVKGKVFFSLISSADLPDFATEYTSVLQSGKAKNGTGPYGLLRADGGTSVVMVSFLPVVDDKGKVLEIIGSIKDITKKVEGFGKVEGSEVQTGASIEEPVGE